MVGVPGRSKGCITCRRRKIACSLERPICKQCIKSKRECLGYQHDRIFVASNARSGQANSPWRPDTYKASRAASQSDSDARTRASSGSPPLLADAGSLGREAARQQLLGRFLHRLRPERLTGPTSVHWMSFASVLKTSTRAIDFGVFALCAARLGRSTSNYYEQQLLVRASCELYGKALSAMQKAITDPKLVRDTDTLCACWLLVMYEIFECPGRSHAAYRSHIEGCKRLIEIRGPGAHQDGVGHSVLLAFRTNAAIEALANRQTMLSQPEWCTIPFQSVSKPPSEHLVDMLLGGVRMLHEISVVRKIPSITERFDELLRLISECWKLDSTLQQLYQHVCVSRTGPLCWTVPSSSRDTARDDETDQTIYDVFPLEYDFIDLRTGYTLILYWTTLVVLYAALSRLYQAIDDVVVLIAASGKWHLISHTIDQMAPWPSEVLDLPHRVRDVCQSVHYCMRDDLGLPLVVGPLNIVRHILGQSSGNEAEIAWINKELQNVRSEGVGIVDYLPAY